MGRSSGARPKKAVKAQVELLRARLGTITSDRWQAAQSIFTEICALCDVVGPSNGLMVPRACKVCHLYGHTRQFCPKALARKAAMTARELELDAALGYVIPDSLEECPHGPAQWHSICKQNAIEERVREGMAKGLGCNREREVTCASDMVDCDCKGCVAWADWMMRVK